VVCCSEIKLHFISGCGSDLNVIIQAQGIQITYTVLCYTVHTHVSTYVHSYIFYVLLTVHPGMILVNNQLDEQFFMYVYFYALHVSGSRVPIIRRIIVSMRHLVYVTL